MNEDRKKVETLVDLLVAKPLSLFLYLSWMLMKELAAATKRGLDQLQTWWTSRKLKKQTVRS